MVQITKKGDLKPAEDIPPSPMEVMFENMNSGPMKAEIMRKLPDGTLESASAKQLGGLSTKSRVAYATQNLKKLKPEERLAWALEMKEFANELYANNEIQSAMEKYVEALSASDFGKKAVEQAESEDVSSDVSQEAQADLGSSASSEGNIDTLIIPCLSNLAACCIQLRDFPKALKFADSALELRPRCGKALMRRGMSLVYIGEYDLGIEALEACTAITTEDTVDDPSSLSSQDAKQQVSQKLRCTMPISDSDRVRVPILLERATRGKERDLRTAEKQKAQLQRLFKRRSTGINKDASAGTGAEGRSHRKGGRGADPGRLEEGRGRGRRSRHRHADGTSKTKENEEGDDDDDDDDDDDGIFSWWVPWVVVVALGLVAAYHLHAEQALQRKAGEQEGQLG